MKNLKDKIEEIRNNLIKVTIERADSIKAIDEYDKAYTKFPNDLLSLFEEMRNKVIRELENLKSAEYVQDMRADRNTLIRYFMDKQRIKLKELLGK